MNPLIAVWCAYATVNGVGGILRASRWHDEPSVRVLDGGAHKLCAKVGLCQEAWRVFGMIKWSYKEKQTLRQCLRVYGGSKVEISTERIGGINRKLLKAMCMHGVDITGLIEEFHA